MKRIQISREELKKIPLQARNLSLRISLENNYPFFLSDDGNSLWLHHETAKTLYCFGEYHTPPLVDDFLITYNPITQSSWNLKSERIFSILDLEDQPVTKANQRVRREIKYAEGLERKLLFFDINSYERKTTIEKLSKFIFLKQANFNNLLSALPLKSDSILVGKVILSGHEISFLMTRSDNILSADFYGAFGRSIDKRINLTTVLHHTMMTWAKSQNIRYYSLGLVEADDHLDYEGVTAYKKQWAGEIYKNYFYGRA